MKKYLTTALLAALLAFSGATRAQVTAIDKNEAFAAMTAAGSTAAKIRTIKNVPSVGTIRLFSFVDTELRYEYRSAATQNFAGVSKLQSALSSNRTVRQALAAHHINIGDVAGVRVGSNGALRVFVLD